MKKPTNMDCRLISADFQIITPAEALGKQLEVDVARVPSQENGKNNRLAYRVTTIRCDDFFSVAYKSIITYAVLYDFRGEISQEEEKKSRERAEIQGCYKASLINYFLTEQAFGLPDIYPPFASMEEDHEEQEKAEADE